jgi:hypothetical protein
LKIVLNTEIKFILVGKSNEWEGEESSCGVEGCRIEMLSIKIIVLFGYNDIKISILSSRATRSIANSPSSQQSPKLAL